MVSCAPGIDCQTWLKCLALASFFLWIFSRFSRFAIFCYRKYFVPIVSSWGCVVSVVVFKMTLLGVKGSVREVASSAGAEGGADYGIGNCVNARSPSRLQSILRDDYPGLPWGSRPAAGACLGPLEEARASCLD